MKRTELQRTVGLARGPVRLTRKASLARTASSRPAGRVSVPTQHTDAPRVAAQDRRTPPGWTEEARDRVSSRSRNVCELGSCAALATDMHHRQRRREGNHTAVNALHLCRDHHRHVHAHPAESRQHGWIVSFAADPACEPCVVRGRLCWLTEDGRKVDAGAVA